MTEINAEPLNTSPAAAEHCCPYLGMADDPQTQFVSPDIHNTCFKAQPPNRVSMRHQAKVCLTHAFGKCPMFLADTPRPLPRELRGRAQRTASGEVWLRIVLLVFSLLALLLLAYFVLTSTSRAQSGSAVSSPVVPAAVLPVQAATQTATASPLPTKPRPTRTPAPSETPQPEETRPAVLVSPGPALETPFGQSQVYLVHMTREGETLDMLAERYDTSVTVLQVVNLPPGQQGMWANLPMVVLPGTKDASGLSRMQAVLVEAEISVADLAQQLGVDEADFRQENDLAGGLVPGGRWVVMHVE